MEFAVRQALRALGDQAGHTADFFGRQVFSDAGGQKILRGCVDRTFEILDKLEELTDQAPDLDTENEAVDPRWRPVDTLQQAGVILWQKGWSTDALRLDRAARKLREAARPLSLEEQKEQTPALRAEIAKDGEVREAVDRIVGDLAAEAARRGVEVPLCVLSDRIYRAVDELAEDRFTYADFWTIARESRAG